MPTTSSKNFIKTEYSSQNFIGAVKQEESAIEQSESTSVITKEIEKLDQSLNKTLRLSDIDKEELVGNFADFEPQAFSEIGILQPSSSTQQIPLAVLREGHSLSSLGHKKSMSTIQQDGGQLSESMSMKDFSVEV
mmetsp:Transcript_15880/g.24453  ORF Transcript_15880/g.24453 Transcript_15880/m.24453 type:complete len:135 (+) Transcript_15880:2128-2532(+)